MKKNSNTGRPASTRSIKLKGASGDLDFELTYKQVKNINLRVKDGRIIVSAPRTVPEDKIIRFVLDNEGFIRRALDRMADKGPQTPKIEYCPGGQVYHLGRAYIIELVSGRSGVRLVDGRALIAAPRDPEAVRRAWLRFLTDETERMLLALCRGAMPRYKGHVEELPLIKFRDMKNRLGSCFYKRGQITFAKGLACLPIECIRYVVEHEFCHFICPDHSPAFYRELEKRLPDHKKLRKYTDQCWRSFFPG